MELVTSDAHQGLKNAIGAVFAGAGWQHSRTHIMVPAHPSAQADPPELAEGLGGHFGTYHLPATVFRRGPRPTGPSGGITPRAFSPVAELLADAAPDILAFTAFPVTHWQKLWSNDPEGNG